MKIMQTGMVVRSTTRMSADLQPRARLGDPRVISIFQQIESIVYLGADLCKQLEYVRDPSAT